MASINYFDYAGRKFLIFSKQSCVRETPNELEFWNINTQKLMKQIPIINTGNANRIEYLNSNQ